MQRNMQRLIYGALLSTIYFGCENVWATVYNNSKQHLNRLTSRCYQSQLPFSHT